MQQNSNKTFLITLFTSGAVYLLAYILVARNYEHGYAALSSAIGLSAYLLIRILYKSGTDFDTLLAKAYRLIIWLVPLALVLVKMMTFVSATNSPPTLRAFYSFDDLVWTGPFVFALWPFLNIFTFMENIVRLIQMAVYYFGIPMVGALFVAVLVIVSLLLKKIIRLKDATNTSFSLITAATLVLAPITGYLLVVYVWL